MAVLEEIGKGAENVADLEGKSLRAPADEPRVGADNPIPLRF